METRIGRKKYRLYALDIETHNDEETIQKRETSMWLGCFIDDTHTIDSEESYFYNMDEFLDKLERLSTPKRKHRGKSDLKNICVYVYNLSFEYSFLFPYMLKRGFRFSDTIGKDEEMVFQSISTKSVSSVWEVRMKFHKKSGEIRIRDLAKIFGGGLGKVAESFGLPTQKGTIDYTKNRLHNYKITKHEKHYCFNDTRIIIDILAKLIEMGDKDFFQVVSMASYSMKKLLKCGYRNSLKPYKEFRKTYPLLSDEENSFLRLGVSGGITYAPSKWQFKDITQKVLHIDAHQMHPSQAYFHQFPYGQGEYFKGTPLPHKMCCCRIRVSYYGVKLHSVISLIGLPFIDRKELVVWDFEIPTMFRCYNELEIEYIDGYAYDYKRLPWRSFYSKNYSKRLEAKAKGDTFNVLYYKLLNNSSYGKLLEKPHNTIIENCLDVRGIINSVVREKEEVSENAKYTYIPVGSCIPARSRVQLIETALLFGWEKVLYFDTDSIFVLLDEDTQKVWDTQIDKKDYLGGWELEEVIDRCQFSAPKRYKTEVDGKTTIKAGGINFNNYISDRIKEERGEDIDPDEMRELISDYNIPYDEVNIISSSWQVQRAYRVRGGTIIEFQEKKMEVQKKYKEIYRSNCVNE